MSTLNALQARAAESRARLHEIITADRGLKSEVPPVTEIPCDVLVTHGPLANGDPVGRLVRGQFSGVLEIVHVWTEKATAQAGGVLGVAGMRVPGYRGDRGRTYARAMTDLQTTRVRRVICVPTRLEDLFVAMALADSRGVPLILWIVQNHAAAACRIAMTILREAFEKATIVLMSSPELRDMYEGRLGIKAFTFPPVVAEGLVLRRSINGEAVRHGTTGVLLNGKLDATWIEAIRAGVREAGLRLDWFGNLDGLDAAELERDGIVFRDAPVEDGEMVERLRDYAFGIFAVAPEAPEGENGDGLHLGLPREVVVGVAAANLPVIVAGDARSGAAGFVERFGAGARCELAGASLREAADGILGSDAQRAIRDRLAAAAGEFSDEGIWDWLIRSGELGAPAGDRFLDAFAADARSTAAWIEPDAPRDISSGLEEAYFPFRRLARLGYQPDFFVDVGASTGVFSNMMAGIFPDARFVLVEPLAALYREKTSFYYDRHPEFELVEVAVDDKPGEAVFHVSPNLFSSSLLAESLTTDRPPVQVTIKTLEQIGDELGLTGRGLMKVDVQCAEHRVLAGGGRLLERVDGILLELSLERLAPGALVFGEMLALLETLGFRYFDECGGWRSPRDGRLIQKDVLFLREGVLP